MPKYIVNISFFIQWNLQIIETLRPAILSFIERLSSLWRLKCTSIIEKGPQSVPFIERFFLLCPISKGLIHRCQVKNLLLQLCGCYYAFLLLLHSQRRIILSGFHLHILGESSAIVSLVMVTYVKVSIYSMVYLKIVACQ